MYESVDLGGVNPMTARARRRWRARLRNPVRKVSGGMGGARLATGFFESGAAPSGGGGGAWGGGGKHHHKHHGGFYPYYPISYPYYYPSAYYYPYYPYTWSRPYYGYAAPTYRETVPSSCCYNVETGSLYCPGSQYDGAPAYAEATRMYQGRPMSFVTSPQLGQAQWFWNCPSSAEPSSLPNRGAPRLPRTRLRAA
jgi:hypothetical protein